MNTIKVGDIATLLGILFFCSASYGEETAPIASWSFDQCQHGVVMETVSQRADTVHGYFDIEDGVVGKCIRFDGYTTAVVGSSQKAPLRYDSFTIAAWVAPQTYAWDWTAIVNQEREHKAGFFFGIDVTGHIGLHLALDGKWIECNTANPIPLLKWSYLVATFNQSEGVRIYVDGDLAGSFTTNGALIAPVGVEVVIGKNQTKASPRYCENRPAKTILSNIVFDGLIDEVKIYDRALGATDVRLSYSAVTVTKRQPLAFHAMPVGPQGTGRFSASYCRLGFSEQWDRLWRIGETPDILVRFDLYPVKYMFWHGTNYGGVWITENNRLMADQSLERANKGKSIWGCPEHMSDKQARYSSVRIIENNDARIVVHWRYAVTDIKYIIFGENPDTGWGEWAEEYYYIYPDAVSTRYQMLWSTFLSHEWQETILLNQPGTRPEDNVEDEAFTVANLAGESQSFSWIDSRLKLSVKDPTIQMTNLRSRFHPFLILQPRAGIRVMPGVDYAKQGTHYLWWNHWPVAQIPSDGTEAYAPDKPSHSSLGQSIEHSPLITHDPQKKDFSDAGNTGIFHDPKDNTFSAVHLTGLTDRPIGELLSLARSWNFPASISLAGGKFTSDGYDKVQRAYVLSCVEPGKPSELQLDLAASEQSPLVNPAFVVQNWGSVEVKLRINGKSIDRHDRFRTGYRNRINNTDLIVWIKMESTRPATILLTPVRK